MEDHLKGPPNNSSEDSEVPEKRLLGIWPADDSDGTVAPRMSKSRYDSISTYLHTCAHSSPEVSE